MNIKKANAIVQQINDTVTNWYGYAEKTHVENNFKEKIGKLHLIL
jgi:hypothetical protein